MSDCGGISCLLLCRQGFRQDKATRQKWFVRNNSLRRVQVLQSSCSSACVETFSTIDTAKFQINKKNLFISKSWQITCPWRHENKAYLVWLMFRMLSNQHYPHHANQKLRSWANAVFQNRAVCGQAVPSFPSPPPSFIFFLFLSQLSRQTSRGNACYAG